MMMILLIYTLLFLIIIFKGFYKSIPFIEPFSVRENTESLVTSIQLESLPFYFNQGRINLFAFFINFFLLSFISSTLLPDLINNYVAFCMNEIDEEITSFPIRGNIVINTSLNQNSNSRDIDGLNGLIDEILDFNNQRRSLLVQSGSDKHLGIIPGMATLPCTQIKQEMFIITNKVFNVLRSVEDIGGLSQPHFLEFFQNLNDTLDILKYFTSKSFFKINYYHLMNVNTSLNITKNILDIINNREHPGFSSSFALPIIAQYTYDYNIALLNCNTSHFYSFLISVQTSTQQAVTNLESNLNYNPINLLRITNGIRAVDLSVISERARLGDNYHLNMRDEQSLTILRNLNFIIRD